MEGASRTAIFAAKFRAAHAVFDSEPIFEDPFALVLADSSEADVRDLFAQFPDSSARVARLFPCQRARFVEEEVERAVGRGIDQYVVLGAGLDSFAWRRTDLMARLDLFEVDHPATQEWKKTRLEAAGLECPPNLHFAGVDFTGDGGLRNLLTGSGFDPTRPAIWSWLGVILYLAPEAIETTLRAVARSAAPGSELVASYGVTNALMDPAARKFDEGARAATSAVGEPQITFLEPAEIEAIARAAGWLRARSVEPSSFARWFERRADGLKPVSYEWLLVAEV